jgi:hypothetical protein
MASAVSPAPNTKRSAKPIHLLYLSNLPQPPTDPVRHFLKLVVNDPTSWHADLQFVFGYYHVYAHKGGCFYQNNRLIQSYLVWLCWIKVI